MHSRGGSGLDPLGKGVLPKTRHPRQSAVVELVHAALRVRDQPGLANRFGCSESSWFSSDQCDAPESQARGPSLPAAVD